MKFINPVNNFSSFIEESTQLKQDHNYLNIAVSRTTSRRNITRELKVRIIAWILKYPSAEFLQLYLQQTLEIEILWESDNFRALFICSSERDFRVKNDRNFSLISDDFDPYKKVKRNQQNYNEILENFLMEQQNQQRKQFVTINDEEFSDEVNIRVVSGKAFV